MIDVARGADVAVPGKAKNGDSARQVPSGSVGSPRRARLVVSRVSPWSVAKTTFVYSLCLFVIFVVAVAVLWSVLNGAGVFASVKSTAQDLTSKSSGGIGPWLTWSRVLLITTLVGLANVVLATVLSAIDTLVYNACAELTGGIEVTLSERVARWP